MEWKWDGGIGCKTRSRFRNKIYADSSNSEYDAWHTCHKQKRFICEYTLRVVLNQLSSGLIIIYDMIKSLESNYSYSVPTTILY